MTITEPYLTREAGDGYVVNLEWPEAAKVKLEVIRYGNLIDSFTVPVSEGLSALRHTTYYSETYAEALR